MRATVTLRRGKTRRGFWVTVTAQDPAVVNAVERAVLGAESGPVRWSYEWADLLVREEADGAYHVYRRRAGLVSESGGSNGLQLEELMVTESREHALLEMGALLEASNRSARAPWSPGHLGQERSPEHDSVPRAA